MPKKISQKLTHAMLPTAVGINSKKPHLDFGLGWAIFRDPRVKIQTKAFAIFLGAVTTFGLAEVEHILLHIFHLGAKHDVNGIHIFFYIFGFILFSVLCAIWLAPHHHATRLRYTRHGVIPMKVRTKIVVKKDE